MSKYPLTDAVIDALSNAKCEAFHSHTSAEEFDFDVIGWSKASVEEQLTKAGLSIA